MKIAFQTILAASCAIALGACGAASNQRNTSADSQPASTAATSSNQAASGTASSSGNCQTNSGATAPSGTASSGSGNATKGGQGSAANSNVPANDPNGSADANVARLDPNAFAYAYDKNTSNVPPQENPYPDHILILSRDPNACESGNFVAKSGEPIITTEWYSFHRIYASPFELHTVQQSGSGLCSLYGQPAEHKDTVTGTLTSGGSQGVSSETDFSYSLAINGQTTTLYEDPNQDMPNLIIKSCNFPTDANAQIPCGP